MDNFADIIDAWPMPSVPTMAIDLDAPSETVKKWRQRNRIPSRWWPKIIVAAQARDIPITLEKLASIDAHRERAAS